MADHYRSKHAKSSAGSVIGKIVIIVLVAAIFVGGLFAVWKFVLHGDLPFDIPFLSEATEALTEPPTEEVTLAPIPVATDAPTEAPTQSEAEKYESLVNGYLSKMSTREKICQLFIVRPEVLTGVDVATVAGDMTKEALADYPVGGIVYFSQNLEDEEQTKDLIRNTQSYAFTPLFIAVDEEGGDIARVAEKLNTTALENMFSYKDDGEEVAQQNAKTIGTDIHSLGFNLDFAPVADVWSSGGNTVIGERAYSDVYTEAASLVGAAVKGFDEAGVISTLKHFPGHGDTKEDSHDELAYSNKDENYLLSHELLPFKAGIEAGADMVMAGHIMVPLVDEDDPASLSGIIVPKLLREDIGYDGIVISDSFQMDSITENYSVEEIVSGVFRAGIDIILDPADLDEYIDAIEAAIKNGDISMTDIENRVAKILTLKYKRGILSETAAPAATEAGEIGDAISIVETTAGETVAEDAAITGDTAGTIAEATELSDTA